MDRRAFFAAAVASLATAAAVAFYEPPSLETIWRKNGAEWKRCRMFDLRPGDVFRMTGSSANGTITATQKPFLDEDGVWTIMGEFRPD